MSDKKHSKLVAANVMSLLLSLIVMVMFVVIVHLLHSKFERTFTDMEVKPSGLSQFYIHLPHANWYWPGWIGLLLLLVVKEWLIKSPMVRLVINKVFFIVAALFMVGYIVSMLMPLYTVPPGI